MQGIAKLWQYEKQRLLSKGFGLAISLATFSFYFTYYPDLISYFWPYLLRTVPEIPLFILVLGSINIVILLLYSLAMYFIYLGKWPFFQQYRISKEPWPWETDPQQWRQLLRRSVTNIAINALLVGPLLVLADCLVSFDIQMKMEQLPQSKLTYLWQFAFFLLVEEIWNYIMHALLHQPRLYWIHKPHHEYRVAVSIAGQYIHPIEYILSSSLSTGLGYKILSQLYPVHMYSLIIWLTFRVIETNDSHAGYNWPWIQSALIPFNSGDNYHFFHHRVNVGNYAGIMYFMDSLMGTNRDFWNYQGKVQGKLKRNQKIVYGKQE